MATPAVTAALLQSLMRQVAGELAEAPAALRVGEVLAGRVVASPEGGARFLLVDGVRLPATLPADVPTGVPLRFRVSEVSPEKLVLQVVQGAGDVDRSGPAVASAAAPTSAAATGGLSPEMLASAAPWATLALPGGQARVWLAEGEADDRGSVRGLRDAARTMVVRYDSAELGRMDVVLRLDPEQLEASVLGQAGEPVARMRAASGELRTALVAATGRSVAISTGGRSSEAIDVSA